ncbi:MAG TPA: DUF362 domain-containing protein, partial [Actinomycetota bacterium]|nr:DUF362 domain-containing protein [Actinomycetota bacterium]
HGHVPRRGFLKAAGIGLALGTAGAAGLRLGGVASSSRGRWDPAAFAPPDRARVAVLRADGYGGDLETLLLEGLVEIGADVANASVFLKPNLVEFDPTRPINTDARIVAATATALRRLGATRVTVGEAPGHRRDLQYVAERAGLIDALAAVDVPFVDLNTEPVRRVRARSSYTPLGELWLPSSVVDADVVISMPKMKTHHWAGVTLSMKNCFGFLPGRIYGWPKNVLHWVGIEHSILDITAAVRPDYAIVDGIVGMEGNGPISGAAVEAGLVVIGDDVVATDAIAASLMGVDPASIAYLAEAGRFLGQIDRDMIDDRGEEPERAVRPFVPAPLVPA